jgi:hypothetical protein
MTCPTCGDYRFVEGPDGFEKVRCPDCMEHCLAHPGQRVVGGHCGSCVTEASLAVELLAAARRATALAVVGVVA